MIWHDHANKILDMPERKDQVAYYKALPESLKESVGNLVKMQMEMAKDGRLFGWRVAHEQKHPEYKLKLFTRPIYVRNKNNQDPVLARPRCPRNSRYHTADTLDAGHSGNVVSMGGYRERKRGY